MSDREAQLAKATTVFGPIEVIERIRVSTKGPIRFAYAVPPYFHRFWKH